MKIKKKVTNSVLLGALIINTYRFRKFASNWKFQQGKMNIYFKELN